jgi:glycine amidinotransferase
MGQAKGGLGRRQFPLRVSPLVPRLCFMQRLKEGRLPMPIKDWEVIEATAEEAHSLGCNTICLEPGVVIIGAEHKRLIREIEKRGVLVVAIPFDKPSELGGGIRCSTHPLLREA